MLKRDYLIQACQDGAYQKLAWLVGVISVTYEGPEDWKNDPRPWRVVSTPAGYMFVDPDNTEQLLPIDDAKNTTIPLFALYEPLTIEPKDYPGLDQTLEVTPGNYLANWIYRHYPTDGRMKYKPTTFEASDVASEMVKNFADACAPEDEKPDTYYPRHMVALEKASNMADQLAEMIVQTPTEYSLGIHPDALRVRDEMVAQARADGTINDPSTVAKISKTMADMDREYLSKDPSIQFFEVSGKIIDTARQKAKYFAGAEVGLSGDTADMKTVTTSFSEGMRVEDYKTRMDVSRAGSFQRGHMTMKGGVVVNELARLIGSQAVGEEEDCGTTEGLERYVFSNNLRHIVGRWRILPNGTTELIENMDQAKTLVGQRIVVRSPIRCLNQKYCGKCAGEVLRQNPNLIVIMVQNEGSSMMYVFMKANHGKSLRLKRVLLEHACL